MKLFLLFAIDTGLSALFGIAVLAIAARNLPIETVGGLAFILALVTFQTHITTLGTDKLLYARMSQNQRRPLSVIRYQVAIVLLAGIASYLLGVVTTIFVGAYTFTIAYALGALRIVFTYSEIVRVAFRARRQPEAYILARVCSVAGAAILLVLSQVFSPSLHLFALIWTLEWVLFSVVVTIQHRLIVTPSLCPRIIKVSLTKSWPTIIQMASVGLYYRFDLIYIGWRLPPEHLGIYTVSARMAEAGNLFFGLIGFVITPLIVTGLTKPGFSPEIRRSSLIFLGASTVFLTLAWIMGGQIITFLFGPSYIESGHIFMIYALSAPFTLLGFIGSTVAIARGSHYAPMVSGLAGALVCVVLTVMLVKWFGLRGAAIATVISYAFSAAIVWIIPLQRSQFSRQSR